jgi:H+/Cl- antiporter ClcA
MTTSYEHLGDAEVLLPFIIAVAIGALIAYLITKKNYIAIGSLQRKNRHAQKMTDAWERDEREEMRHSGL